MGKINKIIASIITSPEEKTVRKFTLKKVMLGTRVITIRHWTGKGKPFVMLHGLLDTAEGWDIIANKMNRPVYAIDLPGFGLSDLPVKKDLDCYAYDVHDVLSKLGVNDYRLVGHSFGGAVAARYAEFYQDEITELILIAPAGFGHILLADVVSLPIIKKVAAHSLSLFLSNPVLTTAIYTIAVSNHKKPSRELIRRLEEGRDRAGDGADYAVTSLVSHTKKKDSIGKRRLLYNGKTKIIIGERDQLIPKSHVENIINNSLPHGEVIKLNNIGHHPQLECPQALIDILLK